jgi:HD-like signal output (HDOD) protein
METLTKNSAGRHEKIEATLDKIYNLPALPDIVTEALSLLNSKTTSNHQLIELISKEQSFVVKVLALAN